MKRNELHQVEGDIAKEIIHIGLAKAADTLSFFVKERVLVRLLEVRIDGEGSARVSNKENSGRNYILSTEMKGDITGKAYLLFDEQEVGRLLATQGATAQDDALTEGFLLEVANILTASVVTQFSNILQCAMHGYVPELYFAPGEATGGFIQAGHPQEYNAMSFTALFNTDNVEMKPEFIWFMEDKFFDAVRNVVTDESKLKMVRSLSTAK
jgi:chemotaxis protein CheY-P-specific phosphatase CheC